MKQQSSCRIQHTAQPGDSETRGNEFQAAQSPVLGANSRATLLCLRAETRRLSLLKAELARNGRGVEESGIRTGSTGDVNEVSRIVIGLNHQGIVLSIATPTLSLFGGNMWCCSCFSVWCASGGRAKRVHVGSELRERLSFVVTIVHLA